MISLDLSEDSLCATSVSFNISIYCEPSAVLNYIFDGYVVMSLRGKERKISLNLYHDHTVPVTLFLSCELSVILCQT